MSEKAIKFDKNLPHSRVGGDFHGAQWQQAGFYFDGSGNHIPLPSDPQHKPKPPISEDGNIVDLRALPKGLRSKIEALIKAGTDSEEVGSVNNPVDFVAYATGAVTYPFMKVKAALKDRYNISAKDKNAVLVALVKEGVITEDQISQTNAG